MGRGRHWRCTCRAFACLCVLSGGGFRAGWLCGKHEKKGLFVCTRQHLRSGQALPTGLSTSMQLNVRLLTKKLQVRAPQGLIQTQSEFMEAFPPPPTSPASHCQLPFTFFCPCLTVLLIFPLRSLHLLFLDPHCSSWPIIV